MAVFPFSAALARASPRRLAFTAAGVISLAAELDRLRIPLLTPETVSDSAAENAVVRVASQLRATEVFVHAEAGTEERADELAMEKMLGQHEIRLSRLPGMTLLDPADLPFSLSQLPAVFSRFRRAVERKLVVPAPMRAPDVSAITIELPDAIKSDRIDPVGDPMQIVKRICGSAPEMETDPRATWAPSGDRASGLTRLRTWIWERDRLRTYKQTRNGMLGPDDSSRFSPWLATGVLSVREVNAEIDRYETERVRNDDTYWLRFELLWRDYFRFVMHRFGHRLFQPTGLQERRVPWRTDALQLRAWEQGMTGVPLVDANMRELRATGFMSNRGRQIVASFLTKHLGHDWRDGAAWFESNLIDYDCPSNWGNWCYAAGVGNDARGFRVFDVVGQAERYDPDADYILHWCPELTPFRERGVRAVFAPWTVEPMARSSIDYPELIVDLERSLVINRERWERAFPRSEVV